MNIFNAAETTVSRQTGQLITLRFVISVPFQLFKSHKCFIDVSEINSPFFVTHNKCITNITLNVMLALIRSQICFISSFRDISFIPLISLPPRL